MAAAQVGDAARSCRPRQCRRSGAAAASSRSTLDSRRRRHHGCGLLRVALRVDRAASRCRRRTPMQCWLNWQAAWTPGSCPGFPSTLATDAPRATSALHAAAAAEVQIAKARQAGPCTRDLPLRLGDKHPGLAGVARDRVALADAVRPAGLELLLTVDATSGDLELQLDRDRFSSATAELMGRHLAGGSRPSEPNRAGWRGSRWRRRKRSSRWPCSIPRPRSRSAFRPSTTRSRRRWRGPPARARSCSTVNPFPTANSNNARRHWPAASAPPASVPATSSACAWSERPIWWSRCWQF